MKAVSSQRPGIVSRSILSQSDMHLQKIKVSGKYKRKPVDGAIVGCGVVNWFWGRASSPLQPPRLTDRHSALIQDLMKLLPSGGDRSRFVWFFLFSMFIKRSLSVSPLNVHIHNSKVLKHIDYVWQAGANSTTVSSGGFSQSCSRVLCRVLDEPWVSAKW